jgi:hypothetical protein
MASSPKVPTAIPDTVTICVTSCGRLDLLADTLGSFRAWNSGGRYLVSEDSTDEAVIGELRAREPGVTVLSGSERLGLMGSIDRLYSAATTPFIFHLEDDWSFDGPVNWAAATALLEARDDIANICVRDFTEIKSKYSARSTSLSFAGAAFRVMERDAHPDFFGWSSNPGLIRRSLYLQYAPFRRMLHDQMSGLIKKDGRTLAYLLPGVARHIGQDRTVTDPQMPPRPKNRLAKITRSIKKRLYYAGWRKSPF